MLEMDAFPSSGFPKTFMLDQSVWHILSYKNAQSLCSPSQWFQLSQFGFYDTTQHSSEETWFWYDIYIYICKKDPVKNNHLWNLGNYFPWHNASINYPGPWAVSHSRKKIRDMSNLKILKSEADSQTILPRASVWNAAIGFGWKPSLSPSHKYQSPHADGVEPTAAQSDRQGPVLGYLRVWDWQGDVTEKLRAF